jgi:chromate transporter
LNNLNNDITIPHQSLSSIFLRFLKFGFLAWGGPFAQIAMIRQELVDEEKWITPARFNRVLAVYQALPGPEAHELCVYFGMIARGRIGAFLGGLGFMLPGFALMFTLSWFYVSYGINSPLFQSIFIGMQPAVAALIVRAVHRIGGHALLENNWLWAIAIIAAIAQLLSVNFLITLFVTGIIFAVSKNRFPAIALTILFVGFLAYVGFSSPQAVQSPTVVESAANGDASFLTLFWSALRSGLLTFGGAYTVIPFLQHDAVQVGGWMTNAQFLDGLALSGLLPAPLVIFSTFVGYVGGGALGAVIMTIGIFTPAFAFTMFGHDFLERLVDNKSVHTFLDGVTAGVVGLISASALVILSTTITSLHAWIIFSGSILLLFRSSAKWTVAVVVLSAGLYGFLFI